MGMNAGIHKHVIRTNLPARFGSFRKVERMRKTITADKVKKLPVGTDVFLIRESTGEAGRLWIVKSGRKKILKGVFAEHEIKDRAGWHYEVET